MLVNPVDVLAFDDQATDAERARAVYVADSTLALKYTGTNESTSDTSAASRS